MRPKAERVDFIPGLVDNRYSGTSPRSHRDPPIVKASINKREYQIKGAGTAALSSMFKIGRWKSSPPLPGQLSSEAIHLWKISLDPADPIRFDQLSADEQARASHFRRVLDRDRFVAARLSLRHILALYLDRPPGEIRFRYNRHGKPSLRASFPKLEFNLSHTGGQALLAISQTLPLGVDLERISDRANAAAISRRVFGTEFAQSLEVMPAEERCRHFLEAWTALEAQTKALGTGVFAKDASWQQLPVVHFEPATGWVAALSSPHPLPPAALWDCFSWPIEIAS